jgi:hypothetical protein
MCESSEETANHLRRLTFSFALHFTPHQSLKPYGFPMFILALSFYLFGLNVTTTGVFAPVAEHTVAKSLLASDVEPGMLPKEPALKPAPRHAGYRRYRHALGSTALAVGF